MSGAVYEEEHLGNFPHAVNCTGMPFPPPRRMATHQVRRLHERICWPSSLHIGCEPPCLHGKGSRCKHGSGAGTLSRHERRPTGGQGGEWVSVDVGSDVDPGVGAIVPRSNCARFVAGARLLWSCTGYGECNRLLCRSFRVATGSRLAAIALWLAACRIRSGRLGSMRRGRTASQIGPHHLAQSRAKACSLTLRGLLTMVSQSLCAERFTLLLCRESAHHAPPRQWPAGGSYNPADRCGVRRCR